LSVRLQIWENINRTFVSIRVGDNHRNNKYTRYTTRYYVRDLFLRTSEVANTSVRFDQSTAGSSIPGDAYAQHTAEGQKRNSSQKTFVRTAYKCRAAICRCCSVPMVYSRDIYGTRVVVVVAVSKVGQQIGKSNYPRALLLSARRARDVHLSPCHTSPRNVVQ